MFLYVEDGYRAAFKILPGQDDDIPGRGGERGAGIRSVHVVGGSGQAAYASACPISGDGLLFPQTDPEPSGDGFRSTDRKESSSGPDWQTVWLNAGLIWTVYIIPSSHFGTE